MAGLIEGKVAIITGAGSGVGRAAASLFARHGARVMASDINGVALEETIALARKEGGEIQSQICDVADASSVTRLVEETVKSFGRLDIMYNNAGVTISLDPAKGMKTLENTTHEDIERVQSINYFGVIHGCQAAIRQFEAQGGGGAIVNTASVAGLIGYGGVVYGASKGAVTSLTRTLAIEVAARDIRVNSVCPSGMLTHFAGLDPDSPHADKIRAGMGAAHPNGRAIDPMDCANAALFLASNLASSITGVNLPVDGGLSAGIPLRRP